MITVRGQILVSRTDDDPLLPVCGFKTSPCVRSKTSPCVPAPRAHVSTSADADVFRATHERVFSSVKTPTEFALIRERLGVSSVNYILRVHGHMLPETENAANTFDEVELVSRERLFSGFTENSKEQVTLGAGQSGLLGAEPTPDRIDRMVVAATAAFL